MPHPVNVLWASGWDSTYRVAELVLIHRQPVQPWYVLNPRRRSARRELAAQAQIREAIAAVDPTAAELLAPGTVRRHGGIPDDPSVTIHLTNLVAQSKLGYQYDVLARLAKAEDVILEVCIHRDDTAHRFLQDDVVPNGSGGYDVRPDLAAEDPLRLFERFAFPVWDSPGAYRPPHRCARCTTARSTSPAAPGSRLGDTSPALPDPGALRR